MKAKKKQVHGWDAIFQFQCGPPAPAAACDQFVVWLPEHCLFCPRNLCVSFAAPSLPWPIPRFDFHLEGWHGAEKTNRERPNYICKRFKK